MNNLLVWNNISKRRIIRSDVPIIWGLYFQDGASPSFEGIVDLHNRIMFYLVIILFGVTWVLLSIMRNFNDSKNRLVYRYLNHGTLIELIWTIGPALILVAIAFPSFKLLYLMDEVIDPAMTVKVTGFLLGQKLYKIINTSNKRQFHIILLRAKNRIGPHNQDVISIIFGSLLGDGYCNKRLIEGSRICFRQSSIHKEYLFWLHDFFYIRGYCSNLNPRLYVRKLKNIDKLYTGYEFNTYTFRSFDWINKLFYHKGKKVIKKEIKNYITPLSLAIWIMDDGGWVKYGVRINTNAFTYKEVELLTKILYENFKLLTSIQKLSNLEIDKYSIYIKSISIPLLRKIVQPYIHSSMLYKIGLK